MDALVSETCQGAGDMSRNAEALDKAFYVAHTGSRGLLEDLEAQHQQRRSDRSSQKTA